MRISQVPRIIVPFRSDFECFGNTIAGQDSPQIRNIHGAIVPIGRQAQNLMGLISRNSFVALEKRAIDGTIEYFRECPRSSIGTTNGIAFIEFSANNVLVEATLKACVYLSKAYMDIGPIFSTSQLNFESLERNPGHPYFSALRRLDGEVTEDNCFWLNSHLIARGDRSVHLGDSGTNFDYLFRFNQSINDVIKNCWLPVVELGFNSTKQCGGVVISPFGDVLTVTHATGDINYIRKSNNIAQLDGINRMFCSDRGDLDLTVIRVPATALKKIFGNRDFPFAKINFGSFSKGNIFMWGFPHLGYPHEPTEQFLSVGRAISADDEKTFYAQLLGLHGHSGSPVFNSSGEVIGILYAGYSAKKSAVDGTYARFRPYFSILDEVSCVRRLGPTKKALSRLGIK